MYWLEYKAVNGHSTETMLANKRPMGSILKPIFAFSRNGNSTKFMVSPSKKRYASDNMKTGKSAAEVITIKFLVDSLLPNR